MINTTRAIHHRLRQVAFTLWALRTINATLLIASVATLLAVIVACGVTYGWRGEYIIQLFMVIGLFTIFTPILFLVYQAYILSNRQNVATYIENQDHRLNDALLTILSAERDPDIGSADVIEALKVRVSSTLNESPINRWVPYQILKPSGLSLLLLIGFSSALYAYQGSEVLKVFELLNERPEQLSQRLAYTPLIGDIKITIHPPLYTGLGPQFIEGGSGEFEALRGSKVSIEAILSRRATNAQIWITQKHQGHEDTEETDTQKSKTVALPLVQEGRIVKGELEVTTAFKWSVSLVDLQGVDWREAVQRRVSVKLDKPPSIKILAPISGDRVDPAKDLKVQLEGKDDFGLSAASIYVALGSDMEHSEELPLNAVKGTRWRTEDLVDLRVVEAQGGDRIALWAEVTDNRAGDEGTQRSTSEIIYLEIDSPQWAHRKLLDQLREHLEVQLEALANRLELGYFSEDQTALSLQDVLAKWVTANQKSNQAKLGFDQLVQKVSEDPLTPKEIYLTFTNHLMKLEQSLDQETIVMNTTVSMGSAATQTTSKAITSSQQTEIEGKSAPVEIAHEGIIIIIEAMVARMALEEMSHLADELKIARANIKELMKMYKEQPSEALKSRIRRELQRFKQKMKAMRELMAKLKKKLPEEFLNLDGMKNDEVADSLKESESQVNSIEKLLEEGRIDEAMKALDELSNSLEEMSQQLQEDMEELHRQTNPELEKALSELMDQTRDLMKTQAELQKDTEAQQKSIDHAVADSFEKADKILQELKEKVQRIKEIETHLNLRRSGRYVDRIRADARKAIDDLERALEQLMIDEGLGAAQRTKQEFSNLKRIERNPYSRQKTQSVPPNQKRLEEAARLSEEIAQSLEALKEKLERRVEEAQAQAAQKQAESRHKREKQAQQEAQRAQAGQPQPSPDGQPQPSPDGQPQPSPDGQPQPSPDGQPNSSGMMGSPGQGLAQRQSKVSRDLQKLRSRLEKKREKIPSLNQVPTEPFEQAQQGSTDAEKQLRQHQPGRGLDGQHQVGEALKQVMKGLQQSKKPQQGQKPGGQQPGGQQKPGQHGRSSTERVEVPDQNGKGPEAMREQLLDAMKSKAARGYDDQVKAYYDSLVR
jgi:hypothetical protein